MKGHPSTPLRTSRFNWDGTDWRAVRIFHYQATETPRHQGEGMILRRRRGCGGGKLSL